MLCILRNRTNFVPSIPFKAVKQFTNKIISIALAILKTFRDFLFSRNQQSDSFYQRFKQYRLEYINPKLSIPEKITNLNSLTLPTCPVLNNITIPLKPALEVPSKNSTSIQSIPTIKTNLQDPLKSLIEDVVDHIFVHVADPQIALVSKKWAEAASFLRYQSIFEPFKSEQTGFFGFLIQQSIHNYPFSADSSDEVCKNRLKNIYTQVIGNAKNWEGHEALFSATKSAGVLSFNRLKAIVNWTTDQHLIRLFEICSQQSPAARAYLNLLDINLVVADKAAKMRLWMGENISAFDGIIELDLDKQKLTELPAEMSYLKNLQRLKVNDNRLKTLPLSMGQLKHLREVEVANNHLQNLAPCNKKLIAKRPNLVGDQLQLPSKDVHLKILKWKYCGYYSSTTEWSSQILSVLIRLNYLQNQPDSDEYFREVCLHLIPILENSLGPINPAIDEVASNPAIDEVTSLSIYVYKEEMEDMSQPLNFLCI